MSDAGARVRTLADALAPLAQELSAGRAVVQRLAGAKPKVPPSLAGDVRRLADAINSGAQHLERTNALLAQLTGDGGGGFGILSRINAFQEVQREIDRLCVPIARIVGEMRALRQTLERTLPPPPAA